MLEVKVVSVPHSGTRFTMEFMQALRTDPVREHVNPRSFSEEALANRENFPPTLRMVMPVRDPGKIWVSRNQRRDAYYQNNGGDRPIEDYLKVLEQLLGQFERYDNTLAMYPELCMQFPIDKPIHGGYWTTLASFLGVRHDVMLAGDIMSFVHAWKPVGAFDYQFENKEIPPEIEAQQQRWGYRLQQF